jgi:hypothetical protein
VRALYSQQSIVFSKCNCEVRREKGLLTDAKAEERQRFAPPPPRQTAISRSFFIELLNSRRGAILLPKNPQHRVTARITGAPSRPSLEVHPKTAVRSVSGDVDSADVVMRIDLCNIHMVSGKQRVWVAFPCVLDGGIEAEPGKNEAVISKHTACGEDVAEHEQHCNRPESLPTCVHGRQSTLAMVALQRRRRAVRSWIVCGAIAERMPRSPRRRVTERVRTARWDFRRDPQSGFAGRRGLFPSRCESEVPPSLIHR